MVPEPATPDSRQEGAGRPVGFGEADQALDRPSRDGAGGTGRRRRGQHGGPVEEGPQPPRRAEGEALSLGGRGQQPVPLLLPFGRQGQDKQLLRRRWPRPSGRGSRPVRGRWRRPSPARQRHCSGGVEEGAKGKAAPLLLGGGGREASEPPPKQGVGLGLGHGQHRRGQNVVVVAVVPEARGGKAERFGHRPSGVPGGGLGHVQPRRGNARHEGSGRGLPAQHLRAATATATATAARPPERHGRREEGVAVAAGALQRLPDEAARRSPRGCTRRPDRGQRRVGSRGEAREGREEEGGRGADPPPPPLPGRGPGAGTAAALALALALAAVSGGGEGIRRQPVAAGAVVAGSGLGRSGGWWHRCSGFLDETRKSKQ